MKPSLSLLLPGVTALLALACGSVARSASAPAPALPLVAPDLKVELVASEPSVRNPCAMAFDGRGRLFVGQGPQYRNPKPDTPGDSVVMLTDTNGDGIFDEAKTFATGLNCIQGLAWHGRDLWVGNSPDLTIVRDRDGDGVADEYVKVFTDLGNIEHANHGHNWAPDGKLYFSQGTSKGLTQPGRIAPKPLRDLWDVKAPAGTPEFPAPRTFTAAEYKATYQDPKDDWGREGGVLRCDDLGANLEIVARGLRNPFDIAFDSGFNWLGTDNDQSEGDRIFMPFQGAHFGWGHGWSTHWTGRDHLPTAPASGPVFDGSGTGIVYYDAPQLPPAYRGVWFFNDWLRKTTFVYRPKWDGALILPEGNRWEPVVRGGGAGRAVSAYGGGRDAAAAQPSALYKPVDIVVGPDGALYVSGWGEELGVVWKDGKQANEGRIFRISWPAAPASGWKTAKREKPYAQWSVDELVDDLGGLLPVWSIDAQDELVRRGVAVKDALVQRVTRAGLTEAAQTWTLWTLGRLALADRSIDTWFAQTGRTLSPNARIQAIRIAAHRSREGRRTDALPAFVVEALRDAEPRVRFAAVQAIAQARQATLLSKVADFAAGETDRVTFYAAWQALRDLATPDALRGLLKDERGAVRRAALLALLENRALDRAQVQPLVQDSDAATAGLAASWLAKAEGNPLIDIYPKPGDFLDSVSVKLTPGIKPATVRYTLDGSEPTPQSKSGPAGRLTATTTLKAALFVDGRKVGNTLVGTYRKRESNLKLPVLASVEKPTTVDQVLSLLPAADPKRGPGLFTAAGCVACHRAGDEGRAIGPDLSTIGDRDDADSVIRSILHPNQIVVEGYSLLTVSTKDGGAFAGIFETETDRTLRLVQLNGEAVSVEKSTITSRQSIHESPMPSFERVFAPAQLADLVAWLMQQRSLPGAALRTSSAEVPAGTGFAWVMKPDRLVISHGGKPFADYVFKDAETFRPHFQNLRAPSGVQVTRTHPPVAGEPSDHSTMHPGVWIAFGDINGQDFWRNKARIEHVSFTQPPTLKDGRLTFATLNRLMGTDGMVLGTQVSRISIARDGEHAFLLRWHAELKGEGRALSLGDQEEMGLGVRVATAFTEKNGGLVVNSDGLKGAKAAWGRTADWAVYSRELDGRVRGAAIFPAHTNPNPVWWHSRDYGLLVANGFGKRVLPESAAGKLVVPAGQALKLGYGVLLFDAPASSAIDFAAVNREFQSTASNTP
ncbi:PVC-type heme-binding CxxCH protein [Horticoccus sp. 23ND18S-11]|uniref:PVC-type heme-binding CxxCH protein n=1 Tax=Horticoccus sp. 23ND18S-11 TaxID=3391832 RepID=UPI0039C9DC75